MIILVFGKPGSGKGSVAEVFSEKSSFLHVSTGDIFRREIAKGTKLGLLADSYIKGGNLVPDDVTNPIVEAFLSDHKDLDLLLDGYPRTLNQAIFLDEALERLSLKISGVFDLECPDDLIIERLTSRRVCSSCGTIYNTRNHNPKVAGICDECGAPVIQSKDDSVESIKNRLMVYSKNTKPLIDYYNKKNLMYVVDGVADSPVVFSEICGILNAQNN